MSRHAILAVLASVLSLLASNAFAQGMVVDSVKMTPHVVEAYYPAPPYFNCGSVIYATWPDVLETGVATDYLPRRPPNPPASNPNPGSRMIMEPTLPSEQFGFSAPEGQLYHNTGIGGGAQASGGYSASCGDTIGRTYQFAAAAEWYAVFSIPSGTPVALYEWEADVLTVTFDGSFESRQSHEADRDAPGGRVPVASYAWDFGDGTSGSGATPTHEYASGGEYWVTLTVTDDDGETDPYRQLVTVEDVELEERISIRPDTVGVGLELAVIVLLKNAGGEAVTDVVLGGEPVVEEVRYPSLPDGTTSPPEFELIAPPNLTPVTLGPNESREYRYLYRPTRTAEWLRPDQTRLAIPADVVFRPADGTRGMHNGESIGAASGCDPAPCTDSVHVQGRRYEVAINSLSGPRLLAGLPMVDFINDVKFVEELEDLPAGELPECENACGDFLLRVRDEDGNLGRNLDVDVKAFETGSTPLPGVKGGFMCERVALGESANCVAMGRTLTVRTNDEGEARVWVALRPSNLPEEAGSGAPAQELIVQAEVAAITDDTVDGELTVPIDQSKLHDYDVQFSRAGALLLAGSRAVSIGASYVSIGEWCEWIGGWVSSLAYDAVGFSRYQASLTSTGVGPFIAWSCSIGISIQALASPAVLVLAAAGASADIIKKGADSIQILWFVSATDLPHAFDLFTFGGPLPGPEISGLPIPILFPQGDIMRQAGGTSQSGVIEQLALNALDPTFTNSPSRILVQEATALAQPTGPTTKSDFEVSRLDADLRFTYELGERDEIDEMISNGYSPVRSISPRSLWSLGFLLNADSPEANAIAQQKLEARATRMVLENWLGEIGDWITVGVGTETPEVLQVMGVEGSPALRSGTSVATVSLVTPLRYDHDAGAIVRRIVGGTLDAPLPPTQRPIIGAEAPQTFYWHGFATPLANADLQVVTDTTAMAMVLEGSEITADTLAVPEGTFQTGVDYFWRVRGRNQLGTSPWGAWQQFRPGTAIVDVEDDEPQQLTALRLGAPYPNPTHGLAVVQVEVPISEWARLRVYDALGREVASAHDGPLAPGRHPITLHTDAWPPGIYVVRVETNSEVAMQRLTVAR